MESEREDGIAGVLMRRFFSSHFRPPRFPVQVESEREDKFVGTSGANVSIMLTTVVRDLEYLSQPHTARYISTFVPTASAQTFPSCLFFLPSVDFVEMHKSSVPPDGY